MLSLVANDPYLAPYEKVLEKRIQRAGDEEKRLTGGKSLVDWADGYLYFGLHHHEGWTIRELAPNATAIYLKGEMNRWEKREEWRLHPVGDGVWEGRWPEDWISMGQRYELWMEWSGGQGERIPAYARRVVQDPETRQFYAQVWPEPRPVRPWKGLKPGEPLFIYECHVGMSGEEEKVATYEEFRTQVLPRIANLGYNCIQLMALQEHPYYGSFGYHVSNFYAVTSRSGTPEDLQLLIEDAHARGMAVIMDLVHSHAVRNEREGLALQDGTPYLYFHNGPRREHPAWDSLCFDYGKTEVMHFLLSNCKYWMDVYGIDGYRMDGVTSMLYLSHGLGEDFGHYDQYFGPNVDDDAVCYLTLANRLVHAFNHRAITIAEDMSGMPGLAAPESAGGIGFDYRLAMGIPDFWIRYIKEVRDEDWKAGHIYYELTNRRRDEHTISYAESHDQALVGDKTIIFRLIDSDMYWHMEHGHTTLRVERGIALSKMIRLMTASTAQGGYMNFMGNEFGHPEWIDFPREGNGWSHKYARRQWSLVDNPDYLYHDLNRFDQAMIQVCKSVNPRCTLRKIWDNEGDQVVAYERGRMIFIFNWSSNHSFVDYGIVVPQGKYDIVLDTDAREYGGQGLNDDHQEHWTQPLGGRTRRLGRLPLYLPARTALVLRRS